MKKLIVPSITVVCLLLAGCNDQPEVKEEFQLTEDSSTNTQTITTTVADTAKAGPVSLVDLKPEEEDDDPAYYAKAKPSSWGDAGIKDPIALKKMIKKLQYWAANNMKDSIATVIAYPLIHPSIANEQEFIANYDTYFNQKVKTALANQKMNQLYRSYQGVMLTGGELWFKQKGNDFKITFINN